MINNEKIILQDEKQVYKLEELNGRQFFSDVQNSSYLPGVDFIFHTQDYHNEYPSLYYNLFSLEISSDKPKLYESDITFEEEEITTELVSDNLAIEPMKLHIKHNINMEGNTAYIDFYIDDYTYYNTIDHYTYSGQSEEYVSYHGLAIPFLNSSSTTLNFTLEMNLWSYYDISINLTQDITTDSWLVGEGAPLDLEVVVNE